MTTKAKWPPSGNLNKLKALIAAVMWYTRIDVNAANVAVSHTRPLFSATHPADTALTRSLHPSTPAPPPHPSPAPPAPATVIDT